MAKPNMLLWLNDARGVYIPRDFANSFSDRAKAVQGVSDEDWATLELGPDYQDESDLTVYNESYWDVWTDVCDNATVTDEHGNKYRVYQDGDCWLIPVGMEWNDETDGFDYPEDRESDENEDEEGE